jgi:hypothetical protein
MRAPLSADEVNRLLEDRPEITQTYPVDRDTLSRIQLDTKGELREIGDDETEELARYLDADAKELDGPFRVVDARCESCDRQITFLDFVRTAVDEGAHDREQLREILTGRGGAWLTIRGQDGGRPVICGGCGNTARMPAYSEYSGGGYAYA